MGTTTELGLDLVPSLVTRTMSVFLRKVGVMEEGDVKVAKMEGYISCLEEERKKIDAFKRELPLCMLILTDVINYMKEELTQCRGEIGNKCRPVLEQFLPTKSKLQEDGEVVKPEKDSRDKMNWMSSVQLWSDNYSDDANSNNDDNNGTKSKVDERNGEPDRQSESGNPFVECKSNSGGGGDGGGGGGGGGGFLPFKGMSGVPEEEVEKRKVAAAAVVAGAPLSDLSLLTPGFRNSRTVSRIPEEHRSCGSSSQGKTTAVSASPSSNAQSNPQQQQQCPRKARRCWSPELHRRFVSALQQLGGSQAATPKQIRELMKVDGLTNDEVKSHLQKYRLHTRRIGPSSGPSDPTVVVLGGGALWPSSSSPDMYPVRKQNNSPSESPQSPLHFARAVGVCEEEDDRSESYSWKGHTQRSNEEECC